MTTIRRAEGPIRGIPRSPLATALRWVTGLALTIAVLGVVVVSLGTFTGLLSVQAVPTGSMEPTIHQGSAIVVDPIAVGDIAVGDIIVFAAPETGRMTVHRVVAVDQTDGGPVFTTRGDANNGPDPWRLTVEGDHLQKVRYAVPALGRVLTVFAAPVTRIALAGLGAAFVLGFGLRHLWRPRHPPVESRATWDTALAALTHEPPPPSRHATLEQRRDRVDELLASIASPPEPTGPSPVRGR